MGSISLNFTDYITFQPVKFINRQLKYVIFLSRPKPVFKRENTMTKFKLQQICFFYKKRSLPSGHKDVRKTSKGRLFRTRGRPIRASNGRPLDGPNATRYVRPNWTSLDVQFGLALDVIVKPPNVKWTSKGRLKTS